MAGVNNFPRVEIVEEGLRDGLQIESADITVEERLALLDLLSESGLTRIVVGAFVSPRWSPSMADTAEVVARLRPRDGVRYTALALNARGAELAAQHTPPLSSSTQPRTIVHACDVFVQRNANRSQQDEMDAWPTVVQRAAAAGAETATIALNAGFGSNWLGDFSQEQRMELLAGQHRLWSEAGVEVDTVWLGDPMGWNTPLVVQQMIADCLRTWPTIRTLHLHLHDTRGSALVSAWEALRCLGPEHTLVLDTAIGGIGGCPYCGNGQATGMIATEDLVDLLEECGIRTGVDRDVLIAASRLLADVLGRAVPGKLARAGVRPRGDRLYAMDMPFVETFAEAEHFLRGARAYDGQRRPWTAPISSPARTRAEQAGAQ